MSNNKENPFRVPEGYFDSLSQRVMDNIPNNQVVIMPVNERSPFKGWRKYAAAAAVVAALFGAGLFYNNADSGLSQGQNEAGNAVAVANSSTDDNFDAVADYIMADECDLYAYMSNE